MTGNTASFRAALWTNLEKLADTIYVTYSQVIHKRAHTDTKSVVNNTYKNVLDTFTYTQSQGEFPVLMDLFPKHCTVPSVVNNGITYAVTCQLAAQVISPTSNMLRITKSVSIMNFYIFLDFMVFFRSVL